MAQDTQGKPRAWWPVAGLLIAAFLARGPLYLSVFPPFEGWDEYQHLAYIVHLDETGTIPVVDERTRVPLAIRPLVLAVPHSPSGADQLGEWGALSYAEYWDNQRRAGGAATSSPRLYQAQHPPLAYALDLPIWRAFKPHGLEAIYVTPLAGTDAGNGRTANMGSELRENNASVFVNAPLNQPLAGSRSAPNFTLSR